MANWREGDTFGMMMTPTPLIYPCKTTNEPPNRGPQPRSQRRPAHFHSLRKLVFFSLSCTHTHTWAAAWTKAGELWARPQTPTNARNMPPTHRAPPHLLHDLGHRHLKVFLRHMHAALAQRKHARLRAAALELGARRAAHHVGDLLQVDAAGQVHLPALAARRSQQTQADERRAAPQETACSPHMQPQRMQSLEQRTGHPTSSQHPWRTWSGS